MGCTKQIFIKFSKMYTFFRFDQGKVSIHVLSERFLSRNSKIIRPSITNIDFVASPCKIIKSVCYQKFLDIIRQKSKKKNHIDLLHPKATIKKMAVRGREDQ